MGLDDREYTRDLHSLLGIAKHTRPDELRYAYDQAMSAATRSGDMVRARTLLAAYEALSDRRRQDMFGQSFGVASPVGSFSYRPMTPATAPRAQRRRTRTPRPRKWGMSFPIRMMFLWIVVPASAVATVASVSDTYRNWDGATPAAQPPVQRPPVAVPPASISTSDAELYVERLNGRADITCTSSGTAGAQAVFACQASDGAGWNVTGTTATDLSAVATSPSVHRQAARFDAYAVVNAVEQCRAHSGELPASVRVPSTPITLDCGDGTLTTYLRPGDSVDYERKNARNFQVTVTAANGETVGYDSRTRAYR